jgi:hypothetical protein
MVAHGGTSLATKHGVLPIIEDGSAVDGHDHVLGSVLCVFDKNMSPVKYLAALEAGDGTVAGFVMVADEPEQLYLVQEDGDANAIDLNEMGMNIEIITTHAGNTNTGISGSEIDSTSAAVTAALQCTLIRPHEDDSVGVDTAPNARWVVRINQHAFHGVVGLGI